MSVHGKECLKNFQDRSQESSIADSNSTITIAAIEIYLSSDHVRYVIKAPQMLDWLAFIGGISFLFFCIAKFLNDNLCCSKNYISPMMEKLFDVQDISKLNNVKYDRYSNKAINRESSNFRRLADDATSPNSTSLRASSRVSPSKLL